MSMVNWPETLRVKAGMFSLLAQFIRVGRPTLSLDDSDIVSLPERVSELTKHDSDRVTASADGPKIPRGSHDNELTRIAGKLRQDGLEEDGIYTAIVEVCEKRCENYGLRLPRDVQEIAKSVAIIR